MRYDVAIIGGGIVGLATAMAILKARRLSLVVLEAEDRLAAHQSSHNSGVVHSGLYYKPGSLKARLCVEGRKALGLFCDERGIDYERCGKVVVATSAAELPRLQELHDRGRANGLTGLRRISAIEIRGHEPHATGLAGLFVPETGIVDFRVVAHAFADVVGERGGRVLTDAAVREVHRDRREHILAGPRGDLSCRVLINCAGLQADRVARMCGVEPGCRIIPFRGEFWRLRPDRVGLVRNLIYPVPDPLFPFPGVHFTRQIGDGGVEGVGGVEVGPNAVLAFNRHGYRGRAPNARDMAQMLAYPGFWRMVVRYRRRGFAELWRSMSRRRFVGALKRLVPEVTAADLQVAEPGIRAQAVDRRGRLVDDFRIVKAPGMVHVINAPSPAATSSISIGRYISHMALEALDAADAPKA